MYLKRIDLLGFKSFPSKTKIAFEPGISCIVGPNGSGKSNVSDALRWVLGEQSTKMLRGGKLEDVIFAGSKKRKPLGMAEVSLVLDNSDGHLPLQFSEIEVTRRNFRGGLSEYLINNKTCRLKDILDLFVDTGIGTDGLSLINQGRVNDLIASKPEERRILVEEAAGIVKYRNRKKEAARKLAETERHLERIGDIVNELESRIDPLAEQSAKAQQYLIKKEESDSLEIAVSVTVLSEAKEKIDELTTLVAEGTDKLVDWQTSRNKIAAEAEQLRLGLAGIDEAVQSLSQEYYALQAQREKAEGQRNLAISYKQNSGEKLLRLQAELAALTDQAEQQSQAAAELADHVEKTAQEVRALEARIVEGAGGEQERREAAALLEEKLTAMKDTAYNLAGVLADLRNNQGFQLQLLEKAQQRKQRIAEQDEQFSAEAVQLAASLSAFAKDIEENMRHSRQLSATLNQQEASLKQVSAEVRQLAEQETEWRYKTGTMSTRVTMLEEMTASYEGFYPGVRELLVAKKKGQAPSGIVDAIANLLDAPEQYRGAVELYLGASLQNIVCETADSAKEAIAWLKKHDAGRATFLPLDKIKVRNQPDFSPALKLKGVYGCGAELVGCDKAYASARDFLLNNMLIVDNMDTAVKAAEAINFRASVVTLDGDMVNPGASMAGGSRKQKSNDILGKRSRLAQAVSELQATEQQLAEVQQQLAAARDQAAAVSAVIDDISGQLHQVSQNGEHLRREKERLQSEIDAKSRQAELLAQDSSGIDDEMIEAEDLLQQLREEYGERHQENEQLLAQISVVQQELAEKTVCLDQSRAGVALQRENLAALKQKLHGQKLSLQKLHQSSESLTWDQEDKSADCQAAEKELAQFVDDIGQKELILLDLDKQLLQTHEVLEDRQHGMAAENSRLSELEESERDLLREIEQLRNTVHQHELKKARWEADWLNEEQKLTEKFRLTFEQAAANAVDRGSRTAMTQRLGVLRREIADIGNVNIDSIEEYREVNERYTFLTEQRDDLVTAGKQLGAVIAEMDGIMGSRFKKAFNQLSAEFNISFRRLFGGGEAALALSEPDNILDTGVEIAVQPPGKKVSNYNLLSGGEKSLIGIALMFAMLAVRPTPFCMMDEVDAALDEANIERFTSFLKEKSDKTQFVMITHRQCTMEAASALWGVTMEEEGVSKVVSVNLNKTL